MLTLSQKNKAVYMLYQGRNKASSLTVTANVYDDANAQITGSPFTLTEINSLGLYSTTFTPSVIGNYKIIISESSVPISVASIKITDYDIESVGAEIVTMDAMLTTISTAITNIQGVGFSTTTDSLKVISDNVDTIIALNRPPVASFDN